MATPQRCMYQDRIRNRCFHPNFHENGKASNKVNVVELKRWCVDIPSAVLVGKIVFRGKQGWL